jgi:hypothetical protein
MFRKSLGIWMAVAFALPLTAADGTPPRLSAAQIVDKNVAARGGLEAWRAVHTMSLSGKLGVGGNQRATLRTPGDGQTVIVHGKASPELGPQRPKEEVELPFEMNLERPRKSRFELQFAGQTAIQVFDGVHGWKLRPYLNRLVVEPFTDDEAKTTSTQADLDGPLVDYIAKGSRVELSGIEKVDGRDNFKIKLTLKTGESQHIWIDAVTFLETKMEGQPRRLDGTYHPVQVYFRDFRSVDHLQIPFILETKVLPVDRTMMGRDVPVPTERISIDRVVLNPIFDESRFSKPQVPVATNTR